jgi:protein phosphatase
MIIGERLIIGHVGDSRAYLRRTSEEGKPVTLLTRDHSLVHKLVEIGQLTPEEAAVHPQRNMLYRAVGQGEALDVDVMSYPLQAGDQLLLCSDGLWGEVPEETIWAIVDRATTPSDACVHLTEAANAAGGGDNITVILVEFNP